MVTNSFKKNRIIGAYDVYKHFLNYLNQSNLGMLSMPEIVDDIPYGVDLDTPTPTRTLNPDTESKIKPTTGDIIFDKVLEIGKFLPDCFINRQNETIFENLWQAIRQLSPDELLERERSYTCHIVTVSLNE